MLSTRPTPNPFNKLSLKKKSIGTQPILYPKVVIEEKQTVEPAPNPKVAIEE